MTSPPPARAGSAIHPMSFDLLAPHYRWLEFFLAGEKLHRCRTAFLDQVPSPRNILLAGEGHGRSLVECRRRFSHAAITCLDASAKMLVQARRQLARHQLPADRIEFIQADIFDWSASGPSHDLVITNFFLDCFPAPQLEQVVKRLSDAAAPQAHWLLSDFQEAPAGLKRIRSRIILGAMYSFFRRVTRLPARRLASPDTFLQAAGFHLLRRIETEWNLLHSDWWRAE